MKRVFAIVLSLCMVLALTACNRAGPEEEGASSPSNAPANSPAASKTDFPSQSFQASVIWGAGGSTDIICRGIAPYVEPLLGQSIIYTNRAGAAGGIAMEYVNSQPADGYELLMTADNPQVAKVLGASNLDLDDFIPINIFCESYGALVVRKDSPYDTYDKLIEGMKAGKVTFGDNGVGGLPANLVAMMKSVEGDIQPVNVSFDGEGSIVTALMGNQIDCSICTIKEPLI